MLILVILVLFIISLIFCSRSDWNSILAGSIAVVLGITLFVLTILFLCTYPTSVTENGDLLAARTNIEALRTSAIKLNSITTLPKGKEIIDVANLQQSSNASSAIAIYVNSLVNYNSILSRRQQLQKNWFTKPFYAKLPEGLELINVDL